MILKSSGQIKQKNFLAKKWDKVLDWNFSEPSINWFVNAKMNITENCLDRHLKERPDQTAIIWEPNDPKKDKVRTYTYKELHDEVCRFSNVLQNNGAKKGDRICIYMPMVPEVAIAILSLCTNWCHTFSCLRRILRKFNE